MQHHIKACIFIAALFGGSIASGSDSPSFGVTPYAGFRTSSNLEDGDTGAKFSMADSSTYGLTLSIPWQPNTELEFWYSHQSTDIDLSAAGGSRNTDLDLDYLHLGGTLLFEPQKYAVPFFVFTIGATRVDSSAPEAKSDTFPSFSVGGGWQFFPEKRVGLRLEGRALGTLVGNNSAVFCGVNPAGSGCAISLSGDMLWQFELMAGATFRF